MPRIVLRAPSVFEAGFSRIRAELDVPMAFPHTVLTEAEAAHDMVPAGERRDARDLPLVAIDPPGATDLDQAVHIERIESGDAAYRVWYAIADVGAFVTPGGAIDTEARARGATMYSPDGRAPLHPAVVSEDRASLLAGTTKPCVLWSIELDDRGDAVSWHLERATVQVREAISYATAQARIDAAGGNDAEPLSLLAEVGRLRQDREADRGGISINLPAQEIVEHNGSYTVEFDTSLPVEGWNAQISLLTGMVASHVMVDAGVGVLRTLPPPYSDAIDRLRITATALDLDWPAEEPYSSFVRRLTPNSAACNAFLLQSTRTLRGAGYIGFDGSVPEHRSHGAIASTYAHVTAPLRRLVDRFGNEIVLAALADRRPPTWALEALDELPSLMGRSRQRESALERALVDLSEAIVLEHSVGEVFAGYVVDVDRRREQAKIQIPNPAVVAPVPAEGRSLAEQVSLRLTEVSVEDRKVHFDVVS